ncbi:MAG: ROK family protein [Candidatus Microbacterium colombiense]|nr:MAG: ROK family protein [Microbacterium sp.]
MPAAPTPPTGTSVVRAINARAALRLMLDEGPQSRPEIAARLSVSKPTASHLLAQLHADGLVHSDGNRDGAIGRAAELFRVDATSAYAASIDVTPERIVAVVVDLVGQRVGEHVLLTPDAEDAENAESSGAADRVHLVVSAACAEAGISLTALHLVVIGIQGAIDPVADRLRFAAHLPGWQGAGLVASLQDRLGVPVAIENDVNLVAIAERAHGVAADQDGVAVLWVSDGIGMGLMFGGRIHRGLTGGAGEIADLSVPGAPTPQESPGFGTGGMQALAGGPALGRVLADHGFDQGTPEQAMRAAAASDALPAELAIDEIARRLVLGLTAVIAILDPDLIVLAGDLALAGGERLRARVEARLRAAVVARPLVLLSGLEENAVLDGGLRLALTRVQDQVVDTVSGGQRPD